MSWFCNVNLRSNIFVFFLICFCSNAYTDSGADVKHEGELAPQSLKGRELFEARFSNHAVTRGDFVQTQSFSGIPQPLKSKGSFVYGKDKGLHWETTAPFYQAITYTPDTVHTWSSPGKLDEKANRPSRIQLRVNRILISVFGTELNEIRRVFDITWQTQDELWRATLVPKHKRLAEIINNIDISGDRYVHTIHITAGNGDVSMIEFSKVSPDDTLVASECLLFEPKSDCDQASHDAKS